MNRTQTWLKERKYWIIFSILSIIVASTSASYVDWTAPAHDPALALGLLGIALLSLSLPLKIPTSFVFFSLSLVYLGLGQVDQSSYLAVLGDKSLFGIAALFIVSSAVAKIQIVDKVLALLLYWPRRRLLSQSLLLPFVAFISSFINNTPLVALLIPTLERWSIRSSGSLSFYLFPISFAAMLGGMCTLVGSSINLVVQALAEKQWPDEEFGFWDISPVGVPVALVGLLYMIGVSRWLFPRNTEFRRYIPRKTTIFKVKEDSQFVGKTLEECGLREFRGIILWRIETAPPEVIIDNQNENENEIENENYSSSEYSSIQIGNGVQMSNSDALSEGPFLSNSDEQEAQEGKQIQCELVDLSMPDSPPAIVQLEYQLAAGDRLFFVGVPEAILQLDSIEGLCKEKLSNLPKLISRADNILFEVTLAPHCSFVGLEAALFEREFNLRIIAINRRGRTLHGEEANRQLEAEDVILVEANAISAVLFNSDQYQRCEHIEYIQLPYLPWWKRIATLLATVAMIVVAALQIVPIFITASCAAIFCALIGVQDWRTALQAIDGHVMLTVFSSLVISKALEDSGAASLVSNALIYLLAGHGTWLALLVVFLSGLLLSTTLSNVSVVSVLFPIFADATTSLNLTPKAVTWTLAVAASCSFLLPVGYQCNVMVQQAGHYSTWQFARVGIGLSILSILTGVTAAWLVYL